MNGWPPWWLALGGAKTLLSESIKIYIKTQAQTVPLSPFSVKGSDTKWGFASPPICPDVKAKRSSKDESSKNKATFQNVVMDRRRAATQSCHGLSVFCQQNHRTLIGDVSEVVTNCDAYFQTTRRCVNRLEAGKNSSAITAMCV